MNQCSLEGHIREGTPCNGPRYISDHPRKHGVNCNWAPFFLDYGHPPGQMLRGDPEQAMSAGTTSSRLVNGEGMGTVNSVIAEVTRVNSSNGLKPVGEEQEDAWAVSR